MGLFDGLSTPRWIDPVESSNANNGMAESLGHNFASAYLAARQEKVLAPMRAMQLQKAAVDLDVQKAQLQRDSNMLDYQAQSKQGEAELATVLSKGAAAGDWTDPQFRSEVFGTAVKYPALMDTPVWKQTQDNFSKSDKAAADAARYEAQATAAEGRIKVMEESNRIKAANEASLETTRQQNADANTTRATTASTLAQWKTQDSGIDNEPQTMTLANGSVLAWRPKGNTLHEIKGDSVKEMSPAVALQVAKELPDKDPNKASIMKMLTNKANGAPAPSPAPAASAPNPLSKSAMGGYQIGVTYKGGLKYLGGDPNVQSNWQKVP